jgi:hypothetical protein
VLACWCVGDVCVLCTCCVYLLVCWWLQIGGVLVVVLVLVMFVCWCVGVCCLLFVGVLVCWSVGVLVCWSVGVLVCWWWCWCWAKNNPHELSWTASSSTLTDYLNQLAMAAEDLRKSADTEPVKEEDAVAEAQLQFEKAEKAPRETKQKAKKKDLDDFDVLDVPQAMGIVVCCVVFGGAAFCSFGRNHLRLFAHLAAIPATFCSFVRNHLRLFTNFSATPLEQ